MLAVLRSVIFKNDTPRWTPNELQYEVAAEIFQWTVGGAVEITEGLAEGDQVVSRAGVFVSDGEAITPVLDETTGALTR